MDTAEESTKPRRSLASATGLLQRAIPSLRVLVYFSCTVLAVVTCRLLGKDMQWDTLHYHLYDGFAAIHDRFGLDYFAAGVQSYFNPYAYAPFYLLATSGLTALEVATILAVVQSAVLWLTYELALAVMSKERSGIRVMAAVSAVMLAFLNPVLMGQFGSSFADITTAELALAGCVLLFKGFPSPSITRIAFAGLVLGAASALKLSNALIAASLMIVPLFFDVSWRRRIGYAAALGLCIGASFALVSAPWSLELQRHFGNPFFPMLNNVFRSPDYTTGPNTDDLFIPVSIAAALWRPFAMAGAARMIHYEQSAPDLRYAALLILAVLGSLGWLVNRLRRRSPPAGANAACHDGRALLALGSAFLLDWALWLSVSGNSRYFLTTACIAAVLVAALVFRVARDWPRMGALLMAAILLGQVYVVDTGAVFRAPLPWNSGPWFDVAVPDALAAKPDLYFSVGIQANAFVVPFLPAGSGFVNLDGGWVLGAEDANGARIRELITRFSPNLRVLVEDTGIHADADVAPPHPRDLDDALAPFGLRVDDASCAKIVVPYAPTVEVLTFGRTIPQMPLSHWYTRYFVTCRVVSDGAGFGFVPAAEHMADRVLDRLEDACPAVLEPRRSVTFQLPGPGNRSMWVRRYGNTHVAAWVSAGELNFQATASGAAVHDLGSVNDWLGAPPKIVCGRHANGRFFVRLAERR